MNPTGPAQLADDTAGELVRAAVAVANLCDERREARGAVTAEDLVDELRSAIAERLLEMMQVFDADDVNSMILHLAEAIDTIGFGDGLEMRDTWVFRRWADPRAFMHDEPVLVGDLQAAQADLLRAGVVVLDDLCERGERTITAAGPTADHVRDALVDVAPGASVDWAGPAPRRLTSVPCGGYRHRGGNLLRVWVPVEQDGHVDEVIVAEDDEQVVVLAVVCTRGAPRVRVRHEEPHRVWLREPLGDREVVDGVTGRPL